MKRLLLKENEIRKKQEKSNVDVKKSKVYSWLGGNRSSMDFTNPKFKNSMQ